MECLWFASAVERSRTTRGSMTVRMATRTALERDCSTLRRVGRMWRKCGDTSHVIYFYLFCEIERGFRNAD